MVRWGTINRGRIQDAAVRRYRGRSLRPHPRRPREIPHGARPLFFTGLLTPPPPTNCLFPICYGVGPAVDSMGRFCLPKLPGRQKASGGANHFAPPTLVLQCERRINCEVTRCSSEKNRLRSGEFHPDHAASRRWEQTRKVLLAGMALRHLALQVLQKKTIRETIQAHVRARAFFLSPARPQCRTDEFHCVLLRIAGPERPSRCAAHPTVRGFNAGPWGSTSFDPRSTLNKMQQADIRIRPVVTFS